jgi:hypothetical protein
MSERLRHLLVESVRYERCLAPGLCDHALIGLLALALGRLLGLGTGHPRAPAILRASVLGLDSLVGHWPHFRCIVRDQHAPISRLDVMSADEHTEADLSSLGGSFAGSLPHLADVSWEDFERASELTQRDLLDGQITGKDEDYGLTAPGASYSSPSKAPVDR